MKSILEQALNELMAMLPNLRALTPQLDALGQAMMDCWSKRGKVLIAGNGGSAADAMHFAEELVVRFQKNRRGLAAISLCDSTIITCAGNDFGYDQIFSRQIEAFGNPGDIFIAMTTSGNSVNLLNALEKAKSQGVKTVGFLGNDGGKAKAMCELPLIVPSQVTARIQEGHKILYHCLCQWIEARVD